MRWPVVVLILLGGCLGTSGGEHDGPPDPGPGTRTAGLGSEPSGAGEPIETDGLESLPGWHHANASVHVETPLPRFALRYDVEKPAGSPCIVWLDVWAGTDEPRPVIWNRIDVRAADGSTASGWGWLGAGDPVFLRADGQSTEPLPTFYGVHSWRTNWTAGSPNGGDTAIGFNVTWVVDGVDFDSSDEPATVETGVACAAGSRWRVAGSGEAFLFGAGRFDTAIAAPQAVSLVRGGVDMAFGAPFALEIFQRGGEGTITVSGAASGQATYGASDEASVWQLDGSPGSVRVDADWHGAGNHALWLAGYVLERLPALDAFATMGE